mmetsp:Transcript_58717/g.139917  ORF Transcript_58717/g.139917 Transcript_58717/m.139917 type:complete len:484 (+) Transcript_58717:118-1569(+)
MASRRPPATNARRRKLSPVGNSWYRGLHVPQMQLPEATVTALCFFDQPPAKDLVVKEFQQHIWPLARFSSIVQNGYWVKEDGPLDESYHFREQTVRDESEIDRWAQSVMSEPLDKSRPLWTVTILKASSGRSALVLRIHHAISDGLGLLFAFFPMMQCAKGDIRDYIPLPAALLGKSKASTSSSSSSRPTQEVQSRPGCLARFCSFLCNGPRRVAACCRGIFSLLVVPVDSSIKINAPLEQRQPFLPYSGRHTFTRMTPVPMTLIKEVRAKHACTVNDVIMGALAGAIRRYCAEELQDPLLQAGGGQAAVECKCTMLMALPRAVDASDPCASLCNKIVTPIFKLPVGEATAPVRLQKAVEMGNNLKSLPYIAGIKATTGFVSAVAPTGLSRKIASEAISKLTCNVTSLPMCTEPVMCFGKELKELQVLFVNNIPQISMMTYNGMLHWNIICDPSLVPEPATLGRLFLAEIRELAEAAPTTIGA